MPSLLPLCCALAVLSSAVPSSAVEAGIAATQPAAAGVAARQASAADSMRALNAAKNALRGYVRRASSRNDLELRPAAIERLDGFAELIPGDDWIVGHRVGLRIKQRWYTPAVAVAIRCEATPWWCRALAGFALHVEGSFADAARYLDEALALMPESVRCEWGAELLHVLDGELLREYGAASCADRIQLEKRIWWLADPLQTEPGNDRRTEHYARVVGMHLHHQTIALTTTTPCAEDHHAGVLRAGWPEWWWSTAGPLESGGSGLAFMPAGSAAVRPLESEPADWQIADVPAASRDERYRPSYGDIRTIDQQTAFFARGDSILAVAAASVGRVIRGGMVLSASEDADLIVVDSDQTGWYRLQTRVPRAPYLVSIEAVREAGGAVRARFGHSLPATTGGGLGLSDLLLFNWRDDVDDDLDAILPHMLGTTAVAGARPFGVYWEVYGATDATELQVSLSAAPVEEGVLRRLGQSLGLVSPRDGVGVRWQDTGDDPAILGKHLQLDLSHLRPGRYMLQLEVREGDGEPVVARRLIEVS
jgi:hypothetical protein